MIPILMCIKQKDKRLHSGKNLAIKIEEKYPVWKRKTLNSLKDLRHMSDPQTEPETEKQRKAMRKEEERRNLLNGK